MMITRLFSLIIIYALFSCKAQEKPNDTVLQPEEINYTFETVASDIAVPWAMAWLPDGSMLVTERSGEIFHIKDKIKTTIQNAPKVIARGQGGLLDIAIHPNYEKNGWIYITYSSDEGEEKGANTQLIRAKLEGESLVQIQTLYKATPNTTKGHHFGSRIVFDNDGFLYFTVGDRGNHPENPQDINRDGGKVYRLHDDGKIPADNPFVDVNGAKKAVYSYGHRNPQGMAMHPVSNKIWLHEHGPKGGDEINIVKKAANYGWPVITYGIDYTGLSISDLTEKEGMEQPIYYWTPSIAPSGMAFVTSDKYPNWKGHLLVGSLSFQYLELVKLDGEKVVGRQKIATDIGRLRDVRQGPDGFIYMAVEGKGIIKIVPKI
jgi:aldose sugar dehydrogenase